MYHNVDENDIHSVACISTDQDHEKLPPSEKKLAMENWIARKFRWMIATSAFPMRRFLQENRSFEKFLWSTKSIDMSSILNVVAIAE